LADLFAANAQSVVYIEVVSQDNSFGGNFFAEGLGSGFVYDMQGHIITNFHVVDGAQSIDVTFYDGTLARAEVVGTDRDSDLAVIRVNVELSVLVPVRLADSATLRVGEEVVAIGNPFGQNWTMTQGIVSALGRTNPSETGFSIAEMIQTDAAINPGNSGGPLLNLRGEVVGVNTMIFSETRSNSGIGFAVPSNTVARVVPVLIQNGRVEYTWLGISGRGLTLDILELMGLEATVRGVLIARVSPESPASRAQLRGNNREGTIDGRRYQLGGDVITAINGEGVRDMSQLIGYLAENTQPGDAALLTIIRDGQSFDVRVILEAAARTGGARGRGVGQAALRQPPLRPTRRTLPSRSSLCR
ncbi:MAG: trypsin-like serine protease, partial [Anaerolineae bacterium]|nr:trypsin-like serine protease [Anaerolineae bacterium]